MKNKKIILLKLLNEVITEVGDLENILGFDYKLTNNGGEFEFEFKSKTIRGEVNFTEIPKQLAKEFNFPPVINPEGKPIISIGYGIEGNDEQYLKSNYKYLLNILKTVINIIKDSISKYSPSSIFVVFATSKTGEGYNDQQKMNLYKLVLQKNVPSGYRIGDGSWKEHQLVFLTKKD
jgi:hypothetical protein